jgi:hypothetical protein
MAAKRKTRLKKGAKLLVQKLSAGVSLLSFGVIAVGGLGAGVPAATIAFRACLVVVAIFVISRIVVSILASSEEMNSGKA